MTSAASHSSKKPDVDVRPGSRERVEPTLYSSVVQTEFKLRQISQSRLEPKPITSRTGIGKVNFPPTKQIFDYANMVDVGLNSGITKSATKPKPREACRGKTAEPKLSDYYRPSFGNVQRIQMDSAKSVPELTVQYDGLAVSRLLNDIDNLVFK